MNIKVRRYHNGDAKEICEIIKKDVLKENIKDYEQERINELIESHNPSFIEKRCEWTHTYVLTHNEKIVGVGMIGPYWGSMRESSFFTIFIDPDYKGQGLGRKIIETLSSDEYYLRAERIEIPASITAVEFYKHMGWTFKRTDEIFGNIVDNEGIYRMEKYPQKENSLNIYNMRPYIDNEYHHYKDFIYQVKKEAYQKYVTKCFGKWDEEEQQKYFADFINKESKNTWIIQLDGVDIGFYNGKILENGDYEIGNICIIKKYQRKGIGTQVLMDLVKIHRDKDIYLQYFKQNPVGKLYERLGFIRIGESKHYYQMKKNKDML